MKTKLRPGWVLALLCTVLFFYGFYLGGVQLVISEVSREYGQNAAGMGGLVAAQHVAAVVLPVVLGALADRIGKKPVLCIFAAVFAVGCFLAGLSKNLGVYVIGAVCVGAGYSVCESVSSAVLSELDAEKGARYINLSQALLSLGAVISPFLVQWLQKSRHASWRLPFLICAAAYTLLALLLLLTVFPKRQTVTQKKAKARTNFFRLARVPAAVFLDLAVCRAGKRHQLLCRESVFRAPVGGRSRSCRDLGVLDRHDRVPDAVQRRSARPEEDAHRLLSGKRGVPAGAGRV